jgi:hypothetical protein
MDFLSLEVSIWLEELASKSDAQSVTYQEYNTIALAI